jgi:hypothetical protein
MTKVRLYTLGTSTTLESNKSLPFIPAEGLHQLLMATHNDPVGAVVIRC